MSAPALIQGVAPFVAPDVFMLPADLAWFRGARLRGPISPMVCVSDGHWVNPKFLGLPWSVNHPLDLTSEPFAEFASEWKKWLVKVGKKIKKQRGVPIDLRFDPYMEVKGNTGVSPGKARHVRALQPSRDGRGFLVNLDKGPYFAKTNLDAALANVKQNSRASSSLYDTSFDIDLLFWDDRQSPGFYAFDPPQSEPKSNPKKELKVERLKEQLRDHVEAGGTFREDEVILYTSYLEDDKVEDAAFYLGKGKEAVKKQFQRLIKSEIADEAFAKALSRLYSDDERPEGWHIFFKLPYSPLNVVRLDADKDMTEEQLDEAIASAAKDEAIRFAVDRLVKDGKVRSSFEPGDENSFGPITAEGKERCRPLWNLVRQAFKEGDVRYLWFQEEDDPWTPADRPMLLKKQALRSAE